MKLDNKSRTEDPEYSSPDANVKIRSCLPASTISSASVTITTASAETSSCPNDIVKLHAPVTAEFLERPIAGNNGAHLRRPRDEAQNEDVARQSKRPRLSRSPSLEHPQLPVLPEHNNAITELTQPTDECRQDKEEPSLFGSLSSSKRKLLVDILYLAEQDECQVLCRDCL